MKMKNKSRQNKTLIRFSY